MKLLVGNLAPETTAEEVKQLLGKYGFPEPDGIQQVAGDNTRPSMVLDFQAVTVENLYNLIGRVDGLYWKGRHTAVSVLSRS